MRNALLVQRVDVVIAADISSEIHQPRRRRNHGAVLDRRCCGTKVAVQAVADCAPTVPSDSAAFVLRTARACRASRTVTLVFSGAIQHVRVSPTQTTQRAALTARLIRIRLTDRKLRQRGTAKRRQGAAQHCGRSGGGAFEACRYELLSGGVGVIVGCIQWTLHRP